MCGDDKAVLGRTEESNIEWDTFVTFSKRPPMWTGENAGDDDKKIGLSSIIKVENGSAYVECGVYLDSLVPMVLDDTPVVEVSKREREDAQHT